MDIVKKMRLLRSLAINKVEPSAPFVRVLPTDYCNLGCSYCWQHTADRHQMSAELFERCLVNARKLRVGLISFLGGEPTLWPYLLPAIRFCTRHHICTDLTTNGSTLDGNSLERLAAAGLDLLNISVDGLRETPYSRKCSLARPGLLEAIRKIMRRTGMRVRINSVICKNNWPLIEELLQVSRTNRIPISLGFVVCRNAAEFDREVHLSGADLDQIRMITRRVLEAKRRGVKVIDPDAYFQGYPRFLARERFWLCNYATRRGWINIDPYGFIRDCTKKFGRLKYQFANLTREQIPEVRARLAAGVEKCNRDCYSNCAFDGAYFAKHKFQFLMSGIT
jgi:MoaA/NifB/PqqE/SkfB family radical SAM enzyme